MVLQSMACELRVTDSRQRGGFPYCTLAQGPEDGDPAGIESHRLAAAEGSLQRQRIYYSNNWFAPGFIDPSELPLLERAGALVR